jgi:hypothetical protein
MTLVKGVKVHFVIYFVITIINSVHHDLAEKQTAIQPLKKFLALYGTR